MHLIIYYAQLDCTVTLKSFSLLHKQDSSYHNIYFRYNYYTSSIEDNLCLFLGGKPLQVPQFNSSSPTAPSTSASELRTLPPQTLLECTWPGFNEIGKDCYQP